MKIKKYAQISIRCAGYVKKFSVFELVLLFQIVDIGALRRTLVFLSATPEFMRACNFFLLFRNFNFELHILNMLIFYYDISHAY